MFKSKALNIKKRKQKNPKQKNFLFRKNSNAEDILSTGRKITEGTDEWKKVSMYYEE